MEKAHRISNPNDPLSPNLYTYCENNPLIYNDPTGHWPEFVNKAVKTVKQAVKKVTTKVVSSISKVTSTASKLVSGAGKVASNIGKGAISVATSASKSVQKSLQKTASASGVFGSSAGLIALGVVATVATGGIAGVAISGALIGAGIGIGVADISDCVSNGGITKTTKDYLAYGLGGAVAGAVAGVGGVAIASKATLKTAVAVGATSSMAGDATTQFVGTGAINPLQTIKAGIAGAVTAGAFYGGAKAIGSVKSVKKIGVSDPSKISVSVDNELNPLENIKFTDKVKAQMKQGDYHSFPESVEGFGTSGKVTQVTGGDKIVRTKVEISGSYKGKEGMFEYIIEPDGITCNHRLFKPNK